MKKALVCVSFGTSHLDALERGIAPIERALAAAFPDYELHRAFTSPTIRRKLRAGGMPIMSLPEKLEALRAEGDVDIRVVATNVIGGDEYSRLLRDAAGLPVSRPLLDADGDYAALAALFDGIAEASGRTLLLMGHGTEGTRNAPYRRLAELLGENARLACVEGDFGLEELLPELNRRADRRLLLMPMMIVAGDHAKNDLAGDAPDSWKSILTAAGFDVATRLDGLGGLPEIQRMFVAKAAAIC